MKFNKNTKIVIDELLTRGFDLNWIESTDSDEEMVVIKIKEEFQILADLKIHRSQQFLPKRPVEIWAHSLPFKDDSEKKRIEIIEVVHNMMHFIDFSHKPGFQTVHAYTFNPGFQDTDD